MKRVIYLFILFGLIFLSACDKGDDKVKEEYSISINKVNFAVGDSLVISTNGFNDYMNLLVDFSDDDAFLNIDNHVFLCTSTGSYTVTVIDDDYDIYEEYNINVYNKFLSLDVTSEMIAVGDKVELSFLNFNNLYEQSADDFIISSSDDEVATYNDDLTFTTIKEGTFYIDVVSKYSNNVKSSIEIKVIDKNSSFVLSPKSELARIKVAEEMYFEVGGGYEPSDFTWNVSNSEVVRIVKCDTKVKILGIGEGTSFVSCYNNENPSLRTTYKISINGELEDVDYCARFINTAYDEVGIAEVGDNHQKYGEWYKNNGQPWCAMFVSWCWYHSGLSNDLMCKYQGCDAGYQWSVEHGIFHYKENYTPKTGDIVFFLSNGASHTGIVAYCDGTYVYTIEGNADDRVGVWRMLTTFASITGYASPNYPSGDSKEDFSWIATTKVDGKYLWTHKGPNNSTY